MKYLITILAITFFGMATPAEETTNQYIYGIWKTMENDYIQIGVSRNFETTFERIGSDRRLQAKGTILNVTNDSMEVVRIYPKSETYKSSYIFSPSKNTLVITKPDGKRAWLLERIQ